MAVAGPPAWRGERTGVVLVELLGRTDEEAGRLERDSVLVARRLRG